MTEARRIVGTSVPRTDGIAKVTGTARYAVGVVMPDMLHGRVVRSDRGAATQGLGGSTSEQLVSGGGQIVNGDMVEYRAARVTDRPHSFRFSMVERADGVGPYGAKGVGEGRAIRSPARRLIREAESAGRGQSRQRSESGTA